ncbi:MAG: hypothetical protein KF830_18920, partial [Planctomycetes bacterium]|nr:hypothetical protein [Planctomycetota bacterium]
MTGDGEFDGSGPNGVPFPAEHEWLELQLPPGLEPPADFVDRTLQAITGRPEPGAADDDERLLAAAHHDAFAPPPPSPSFVDDTLAAIERDRRQRWREVLTRHVAPEPSADFVARTLAALATGSPAPSRPAAGRWRRRLWPWAAAAAAAVLWWSLRPAAPPPLERRLVRGEP